MVASHVCQEGQVWNSNREEVVFAMTLLSYCANKRQKQLTPHCVMTWWEGLSSECLGIACANINQVALVFTFMFSGSHFYWQIFEYMKNVNVIQFVYSLDSYSQFVPQCFCPTFLIQPVQPQMHLDWKSSRLATGREPWRDVLFFFFLEWTRFYRTGDKSTDTKVIHVSLGDLLLHGLVLHASIAIRDD